MVLKVFEVSRRFGSTEVYACESLKQLVTVLNDVIGEDEQYVREVVEVKELHQRVKLVVEPQNRRK